MTTLKRGSKGEEVARFQAMLRLADIPLQTIDGDFGPATERATQIFQKRFELPATGVADSDTCDSAGMNRPDPTKTPVPVIDHLSVEWVAKIFPRSTPLENIETYLPPLLDALREADMDDRDLVLMTLGTIRAETERFEPTSEHKSKSNTDNGAHPFNKYDDRADLGNTGRPDGERFRGRGFIPLTGRGSYERFGERLGIGSALIQNPALANSPEIAAKILTTFIADKRPMAKYAILGGDLATARKLVNGHHHGLDRFAATFESGARLLSEPA